MFSPTSRRCTYKATNPRCAGYVIHEADWDDDEFVVIDGTTRFESDAQTRTQWEKGPETPASGSDSEETASDSETKLEKQARLF